MNTNLNNNLLYNDNAKKPYYLKCVENKENVFSNDEIYFIDPQTTNKREKIYDSHEISRNYVTNKDLLFQFAKTDKNLIDANIGAQIKVLKDEKENNTIESTGSKVIPKCNQGIQEYPQFDSTGIDKIVEQSRCAKLNKYLKESNDNAASVYQNLTISSTNEDFSPNHKVMHINNEESAIVSHSISESFYPKLSSNKRYHSIIGLDKEQSDINYGEYLLPNRLYKSKSFSLSNLSFSKSKYDHIPSKVKLYIQERKRQDAIAKSFKNFASKSVPASPIKEKNLVEDVSLLDEKVLQNLAYKPQNENDILSEEFRRLKEKLKVSDEKEKCDLVESLLVHFKEERKRREDQDLTLNTLQLEYDNLLAKYAEAEIMIDNLRFYKYFYDATEERSHSHSSNTSSRLRKALSTSNIVTECLNSVIAENIDSQPNLKRYSSTPIVDPNINFTEKDDDEKALHSSESLRGKSNNEKARAALTNSQLIANNWKESCKYLHEKLKECVILEANSALTGDERNTVWNFVLDKYVELVSMHRAFNAETVAKHNSKKVLANMKRAIEGLLDKYGSPVNGHFKDKLQFSPREASSSLSTTQSSTQSENSGSLNKQDILLNDRKFDNKEENLRDWRMFLSKDQDSGYPPSERSTKNSQLRSFDNTDSRNFVADVDSSLPHKNYLLIDNSAQKVYKSKQFSNWSKVGRNMRHTEEAYWYFNSHKMPCKANEFYSDTVDEDYDASGSSDQDSLIGDNDDSSKTIKKLLKVSKPKYLSRYEDRFVKYDANNVLSNSDFSVRKRRGDSSLFRIEKNLRYFEANAYDFSGKGFRKLKVDKSPGITLSRKHPNSPLKAFCKDSYVSLPDISDLSIRSSKIVGNGNEFGATMCSVPFRTSYPPDRYANSYSNKLHCSTIDENACDTSRNPELKLYPEYCDHQRKLSPSHPTGFATSTPIIKLIDRKNANGSLRFEENDSNGRKSPYYSKEFLHWSKLSQSVPSLACCDNNVSQPYIYIEHYNCKDPKKSFDHTKDKEVKKHLKTRIKTSKRCLNYGSKYPDLLSSLNEATQVAELIKTRSEKVLKSVQSDLSLIPKKIHHFNDDF